MKLTNTLFVSFSLLSLSVNAFSEEISKLGEIKVESDFISNISNEDLKKFGGSRSIITTQEAQTLGDNTIGDAMKRIPGVISSKQDGTGASPSSLNIGVRGMTQRLSPQSTVLVDGIPLAVAPYGQPQLSLAPLSFNMLSEIDIIRGGGTVRYGPQNVGGVINFITKDIPDELQTEISTYNNYYSKGNNGIENNSISLFTGGMVNDYFGLALFYDGMKGSNWRDHSRSDIDNIMLKSKYLIHDHHELIAKLSYYHANNEMAGGLTQEEYKQNPYQSKRSEDKFNGNRKEVVLDYKGVLSKNTFLDIKTFYNTSEREFTFSKGAPEISTRFDRLPRDYNVFGLEGRIAQKIKIANFPTELAFGYRYINEDSNEKRYRKTTLNGAEVNNRNSHNNTYANSFYTDWRWEIDNLTITPGVRFEDVKITRENKLTNYNEEVKYYETLPALSLNYKFNDQWSSFFNYNSSFGSVQHLQLNLKESSEPTDLNPEKADMYEIGTRYFGDYGNLELALYHIDFDNKLGYNYTKLMWDNNGKSVNKGIEISGKFYLDSLHQILSGSSIYGNYTYNDAEYRAGKYSYNQIEFTSKHTGLIGYEYMQNSWSAFTEIYAQSKQYSDPKNTVDENTKGDLGVIDGYTFVNLGYNKEFNLPKDSKFSFSAGIKNLFDKETYTRSTDTLGNGKYVGMPRTVYFALKLNY